MAIQAVEQLTPTVVLAELHACNHTEKAASARRLELAVMWAELHPAIADQPYDKVVDSLIDETTGATVAAIAEFAAVHGVSTNTGRQLIGDAVTLHARLPRCWHQMIDLRLPAWKARLLAQTAHGLGDEAVDWLDRHASILGAKLGVRTIKRLALTAIARFEPDRLPNPEARRWVRINTDTDTVDGASWLDGRLDTPDALDLEAALRLIAHDLAEDGVEQDLDLRRAHALGVMARRTLGQPELPTEPAATGEPDADVRDDDRLDTDLRPLARTASPETRGPVTTRDADATNAVAGGEGASSHEGQADPGGHTQAAGGRHASTHGGQADPGGHTQAAGGRHASTHGGQADPSGHAPVAGSPTNVADPLDLINDNILRDHAGTAGPLGSDNDGLADPPAGGTSAPAAAASATTGRTVNGSPARQGRPVSIYLHFDATQLTGCGGLGEVGTTGQLVTIDQIRTWCGTAGTISIRPVIDLNQDRRTRGYQPTDVMREHLALRDRTCVFPHCTRPAHPVRKSSTGDYSHDADHIIPYDSGGETSTDNLACLCRLHHLLKTHTGWRYEMIGPGEYVWVSPGGQKFLRTNSGTTMFTTPRSRGKSRAA